MSPRRSLPVLMPDVPDQRWSCHSCAICCRRPVVVITENERVRIDRQGWARKLGVSPYARLRRQWVLNKTPEGACVFLDPHNRCRIHNERGEQEKPMDCRLYPLALRRVEEGWRFTYRYDCPSMARNQGRPIRQQISDRQALVLTATTDMSVARDRTLLPGRVVATPDERRMILDHFIRWLHRVELPFAQRLVGAARVTTLLSEATFKKVRGSRLRELLDILFGTLEKESTRTPDSPTPRQLGMLRQLVFAHAEHLTLAEMLAGRWARLTKRHRQLRCARRFLLGRGPVPPLPDIGGPVTFESVESVGPSVESDKALDDMLQRYLLIRLKSRAVCGAGYYGWPIVHGLSALWLAVAVVGWLARYLAAQDDRPSLTFDDGVTALGVVDATATRSPALGTSAERMRITYLFKNDGLARLIRAYGVSRDGTTIDVEECQASRIND